MRYSFSQSSRGFTLIEVMIVVVIVAILSAIAVPSYTEYVQRGRLVDAHTVLANARVQAELFFQDNRTYNGMPCPASANNFTFACNPTTASAFTVTATGSGPVAGFVMTINQANARATTGVPTGWTANNTCWVLKKGGSC
jgi:type IV pilus assembly protein PilE